MALLCCPACGARSVKLFQKQRAYRCTEEACGEAFEPGTHGLPPWAVTADAAPSLAGIDLEVLPSVVAIPLADYAGEDHPTLKLWAACDAVELTLRLLVAVGVADVLQMARGKLPDALRRELGARIHTPTLGAWRAMARAVAGAVAKEAARTANALVPELPSFVATLETLLQGTAATAHPETSLAELRNLLAHSAIGREVAAGYLQAHAPRFEETMRAGAWLGELRLVARRGERAFGALLGPRTGLVAFDAAEPLAEALRQALRSGDAVVLVRGNRTAPLWPLVFHGVPTRSDPDAPVATEPVPQIYSRHEVQLLLTPLGSREVARGEESGDALQAFLDLYRAEDTNRGRTDVASFDADVAADAARWSGSAQAAARATSSALSLRRARERSSPEGFRR